MLGFRFSGWSRWPLFLFWALVVAAEQLGDFYVLKRGKKIACFVENLQPVIMVSYWFACVSMTARKKWKLRLKTWTSVFLRKMNTITMVSFISTFCHISYSSLPFIYSFLCNICMTFALWYFQRIVNEWWVFILYLQWATPPVDFRANSLCRSGEVMKYTPRIRFFRSAVRIDC